MLFRHRFRFKPRRSLFPNLSVIVLAYGVYIALWLTCTKLYSEAGLAAHLAQTAHSPLQQEFGHADKLSLHTLPVPVVDAGEVLICIKSAGVDIYSLL